MPVLYKKGKSHGLFFFLLTRVGIYFILMIRAKKTAFRGDKMSSQADHGGHRERMRKRFKESGSFKGFSEHEILEMLLFYIVPRKNTNDIAHALIKKFGSLNGVLNASAEEISSVKDMGESSANSIVFFKELINYCSTVTDSRIDVRNISATLDFVKSCFRNEKQEKFKVICIDTGFHIKSVTDISSGGARFTAVDFRELTKAVLNSGTDIVILAHNHPDAPNTPSQEDVTLTREVMRYMRCLGVTVLDHYIAGNNGAISMRNCGLIHDMEC